MKVQIYKTLSIKPAEVSRKWLLVDAEGQPVGRLASKVATLLRGKHKPIYTPHVNCGDKVIIINAEKVVFSGSKMETKQYIRYSGYPGGQRVATPTDYIRKGRSEFILEHAIKGMLPKNKLGKQIFTKNLHVVAGTEHGKENLKPQKIDLTGLK